MMQQIAVNLLDQWLRDPARPQPQLIDVREPWEFALGHLPGAVNIPMQTIPNRQNEIEDGPVVTICHHGMRSYQVALFLGNAGFTDLYNLTGGVDAWALQIDPSLGRY